MLPSSSWCCQALHTLRDPVLSHPVQVTFPATLSFLTQDLITD